MFFCHSPFKKKFDVQKIKCVSYDCLICFKLKGHIRFAWWKCKRHIIELTLFIYSAASLYTDVVLASFVCLSCSSCRVGAASVSDHDSDTGNVGSGTGASRENLLTEVFDSVGCVGATSHILDLVNGCWGRVWILWMSDELFPCDFLFLFL